MELKSVMPKHKKGSGVITSIVAGVGALVITVIIIFVILSTLNGASLLTAGSAEAASATAMIGNLTEGVDNVSGKLPTILLIAAVVLLFGVIVILVSQSRKMGLGGGGI